MSSSIVRTWSGVTSVSDADAYLDHLQNDTIPHLRALEGFEDIRVLRREVMEGIQFIVMTTWCSFDAVRAFAGDELEVAVVPATARALLLRFDPHVRHYEAAIAQ